MRSQQEYSDYEKLSLWEREKWLPSSRSWRSISTLTYLVMIAIALVAKIPCAQSASSLLAVDGKFILNHRVSMSNKDLNDESVVPDYMAEVTLPRAKKQDFIRPNERSNVLDNGSLRFLTKSLHYPVLTSNNENIFGYPWPHIVEPFRVTVFEAVGESVKNRNREKVSYRWELVDAKGCVIAEMNGKSVQHTFTNVTEIVFVTLKQYSSKGKLLAFHTSSVICKYVRREVRELTEVDLKLLLDTMQILWDVNSEEGQKIYGDKYRGIYYFTFKHIAYSADPVCNHFHEGPGFITQHMALTLEFEQALQAVEPSISVPFWDFTLDAELYGSEWALHSPVLNDEVFGSGILPTPTVNRGRWGYTSIGDYGSFFDTTPQHNSYGLLRAPFNNNPYPFLTRWHDVTGTNRAAQSPNGCSDYWNALYDQTWSDLELDANTNAHGSLHSLLGGAWYDYENTSAKGKNLPYFPASYVKYFWRAGYMMCPKYCAPDVPTVDCQCRCNFKGDSWAQVLDNVQSHINETIFKDMLSKTFQLVEVPEDFEGGRENYVQYLLEELVCNMASFGDHLDSESTMDPTFWPIHPTFDRLVHWIRLSPEPMTYDWGSIEYSCSGHNPSDIVPFANLFLDDSLNQGYYTNQELYEKLHPSNDFLPYVYSNFEWPHCEILGFNMSNSKLKSDLEQVSRHLRPSERNWVIDSVDWSLPWSKQKILPLPSEIIAASKKV